jgi:hypothetical protein
MAYRAVIEARREAQGEFGALEESLRRKRFGTEPLDWPRPTPANDNDVAYDWPRIVGLQGYGGSGKSEVRRILERRGYVARHIKAPIAEMTRVLLGYVTDDDAYEYTDGPLKRAPIPALGNRTATEIQQELGTAFGRDFISPTIWLDIWARWADEQLEARRPVVQESVRFTNEADAIRARGGVVFEVRRPGVGPVNAHVSEALPAKADYVIHNTGDLSVLESRVITAMEVV